MQKTDNTLATSCFEAIQSLILEGTLNPGEKLKGEFLKQQLKVGLSPVREALFRLVGSNLVEFEDKIGFRVASITERKIHDVFETSAKIECLMLTESIKNGNDEWEAQITSSLYKLSKIEQVDVKQVYPTWVIRNNEFHNALISACNIQGLTHIRNNCLLIKEWYTNLANKDLQAIKADHQEHTKLAKLAIERKTDLACRALHFHLTKVVHNLVKSLNDKGFINS